VAAITIHVHRSALHGQVREHERRPGHVVAGVEHDQHVRVTGLPLTRP
jgi:hypothetical protein